MKNTLSYKIIAVAMTVIMIATLFTACGTKKNEAPDSSVNNKGEQTVNGTAADTESANEASDTNAATEENTSAANKTDAINTNDTTATTALNSVITTTTKPNQNSTTTTKPSGNGKPVTTTTTKAAVSTCKHDYSNKTYAYNHYINGYKYQVCTKCGEPLMTKCSFVASEYMGTQAEYMELFKLINKARRDAGLVEVEYMFEFQAGSDVRAKEIQVSFSHTRPNGQPSSSAFNLDRGIWAAAGENIVGPHVPSPESAFDSWMKSPGHKANILHPNARGFVCSRCNGDWTMTMFIPHSALTE